MQHFVDSMIIRAYPEYKHNTKYRLGKQPKSSKVVASLDECLSIALKVSHVGTLDFAALLERANEQTRQRAMYRQAILYPETIAFNLRDFGRSHLLADDAENLVACGIASRVSEHDCALRPTRGYGRPFTIVEEKVNPLTGETQRVRRFILWPKEHNRWAAKQGYQAFLPELQHFSSYANHVLFEAATIRDLRLSFYQLEIPLSARALYRFCDLAGNLYEARRGVMGHSCMPEDMQMTAAIIAGDPNYCKPEFALFMPARTVWIDNIRLCGSHDDAMRAAAKLDEAASQLRVTWKPSDSLTNCTQYEFLGAAWNHDDSSISLSVKLQGKIPLLCPETMRVSEMESTIGRLVNAAGILQIPLGTFYPAMKWYRRIQNKIGRGVLTRADCIIVPKLARYSLGAWLDAARTTTFFPREKLQQASGEATLVTDASLYGFGGILISPLQEIFVVGGKWICPQIPDSINELEASAVLIALHQFQGVWPSINVRQLNIVVDNTSVRDTLAKGSSKSERLNRIILMILNTIKDIGFMVTIRYIPTDLNPSDSISRGRIPDWATFSDELATWMNLRQGEGAAGIRSRVLP